LACLQKEGEPDVCVTYGQTAACAVQCCVLSCNYFLDLQGRGALVTLLLIIIMQRHLAGDFGIGGQIFHVLPISTGTEISATIIGAYLLENGIQNKLVLQELYGIAMIVIHVAFLSVGRKAFLQT
jgi:hypothetical protein